MPDKFLGEVRNNFQFLYNKYFALEGEHAYDNLPQGNSVIVLMLDRLQIRIQNVQGEVSIQFSKTRNTSRRESAWVTVGQAARKLGAKNVGASLTDPKAKLSEKSKDLELFLGEYFDKFKKVFM